MDHRIAGRLGLFGLRAAILAARERDSALAHAGLIAFAIVDLTGHDIRDFLVGFTLLVHCAARAGADVPALLRDTASLAGPAIGTLYIEWADRYPDVAAIGSMGWREVETDAGPGFRNW